MRRCREPRSPRTRGWRHETTFADFRIWWHHFFYTALTDQLAAAGAIRVPEPGLFHYVMIR
jgi:hypothetical protein